VGVRAASAVRGTHPGSFAVVMAAGIVSAALRAAGDGHDGAATAAAAAALPAWLALTCLVPGRMAVRHRTPPALTDIGGNWYLWAVGTQSFAIAATFLWAVGILGARPAALLAIAAWLSGAALYLLITALVVARLLLAGLAPHNPTAPYWVAALPGGICSGGSRCGTARICG
jgi:hypothetical protein